MGIREFLGKEILYFDGAMGTRLQEAGMKPGELPEIWNITHPEVVTAIHASYIKAGANILKSNTFGANRLKLEGSGYSVEAVVSAALKNARAAWELVPSAPHEAVPGDAPDVTHRASHDVASDVTQGMVSEVAPVKRFVSLDLGPTGKLLAPYGDLPFEEAVSLYAEMVRAGVKAGADLILIETMSDTYEAKAAILAAKENSDLPVFVTFTFDRDGNLLNGASVETAMLLADGLGVDAAGFNCGLGPDLVAGFIPRARAVTKLPLIANSNAGLPVEKAGKTVYTIAPYAFAAYMKEICRLGGSVLGGCCGTSPDFIRTLAQETKDMKPSAAPLLTVTAATGYGRPVYFDGPPVLIGERINPTGKPLLKEALQKGNMDYVCRLGLEQLDRGAHVLDVNVGLPGLDEKETLGKAVSALQAITSVPLEIDTANPAVMEKGLRLYNGRPILNSVNGKQESMEQVFPLVKKYGALVVGLCLDEKGIPATAEGRLAVAEKIIREAEKYGISTDRILVDPLALTVSTDSRNPQIDEAVIRALRSRGIHTVMGVSNVSFGLPNRDAVNSAFFTLMLAAGLSSAIINPQSVRMMETYYAFCALSGQDEGCKNYVARFADMPKNTPGAAVSDYTLYDAVVKGLVEQSGKAVKKLLAENKAPLDIINQFIIPALNTVGEGFGKKTLFLPQLLMAADAAKEAFEVLKTVMSTKDQTGTDEENTIVLAVVKGDIHDIGKNIVKVLWENYGYTVVDLGKDVPPETIVAAVDKYHARLVGLTALMTTTVASMEEAIAALRKNTDVNILVGGAVMTRDYAATIGADGYAPDAVAAVDYANELLRKKTTV